jgi:hypothetical protein
MGNESYRDNVRGIRVHRMMELVYEHGQATTKPGHNPGSFHGVHMCTCQRSQC